MEVNRLIEGGRDICYSRNQVLARVEFHGKPWVLRHIYLVMTHRPPQSIRNVSIRRPRTRWWPSARARLQEEMALPSRLRLRS